MDQNSEVEVGEPVQIYEPKKKRKDSDDDPLEVIEDEIDRQKEEERK